MRPGAQDAQAAPFVRAWADGGGVPHAMGLGARLPTGGSELREAAERIGEEDRSRSKACRCEIEETGCSIDEIEGSAEAVKRGLARN